MMRLSGNLGRVNAILLLLVAPIVVRVWIEAVVWRLQRGPQMLGFSLLHGGAGWLSVPLLLSFLAISVYSLWVIVVMTLWAIPASRRKIVQPHFVLLGGASLCVFMLIAQLLQQDMRAPLVWLGAAGLTALVGTMGWLTYAGFRRDEKGAADTADYQTRT
jgi:hypothetical protein